MAYDDIISRSDASALVPEQVSMQLMEAIATTSIVAQTFQRIPVASNAVRFPVLQALPQAYWVSPTDVGMKQTTEAVWANTNMNIEEIASIVVIPDSVVADVSVDIWSQVRGYLANAVVRTLDSAVFFGTNKPSSFPDSILDQAIDAGNVYSQGTSTTAQGGLAGDFNGTFALVEDDGFAVNGVVAKASLRAAMRNTRDTSGQLVSDFGVDSVYGQRVFYGMDGLWPTTGRTDYYPSAFVGDWSKFLLGIRQDITYSVHRDGVITDNTGAIQFNLMQQDMTALRIVMRVGWVAANPVRYANTDANTRFPAAVLGIPD